MRSFLLVAVLLTRFGGFVSAADAEKDLEFYEIAIVEFALSGDVALPEELPDSPQDIYELFKAKDGKSLQETMRFSALASRPTSVTFGGMYNAVSGHVERNGEKRVSYTQVPVGTQARISVAPIKENMASVKLSYTAMRVATRPENVEEMATFAQTQLTIDTQIELNKPTLLLARSETDRRYIVLTVKPK